MSMKNIAMIIKKTWGDVPVTYEVLTGGFVNFSYKVCANGKYFVLRINGKQNDYLGLSRAEEVKVFKAAHDMNIAPAVLPQSTPEYLITEYINAPVLSVEELREPVILKNAIENLKKIHTIQNIGRNFSPFELLEKYTDGMRTLGVIFPEKLNGFLRTAEDIEKRWNKDSAYRKAYCHNDYFPANIINDNGRLYVIDWELSGVGDIFFDLATMSFSCAFSDELDKYMLQCYFGQTNPEPEHFAALLDMKYMNMLREATWGLLHSGIKEDEENTASHDMNYYEFGEWVLGRLDEGILHL